VELLEEFHANLTSASEKGNGRPPSQLEERGHLVARNLLFLVRRPRGKGEGGERLVQKKNSLYWLGKKRGKISRGVSVRRRGGGRRRF